MPSLEKYGKVYETDVLVVGGGLAGVNAAIAAAEKGAKVIVVDKGAIERSGSMGGGIDHFQAYLESGEDWDTREAYLQYAGTVARGAVNLKVINQIYCRELPAAIERLARIGNPVTQPDGTYYRTRSLGMPGPYMVNFNGKHLKPRLAKEAKRLGCKVLEKVAVTDLLRSDGGVSGITGFNIRTGEGVIVRAKAIVLSTGNTNRLFENPTGLPFNTWQCPADTGAAQSMAFRAGAALANMEYVRITVVPKGFSAAGLNALTGMGGKMLNSLGEEFMPRYHPGGTKAPRFKLVEGVLFENQSGRGPVFMDCRHLSKEEMEHLYRTLGYDKDTLPDFIRQKGLDLSQDLLEIMISEGMQSGPGEVCASGIKIDETCASSLPGIYAAGDCADQTRCCSPSIAGGYAAGKGSAVYAQKVAGPGAVDEEQIVKERERVFAPLKREEGLSHREFEDILRKIMWENVGVVRTDGSLRNALTKLEKLEGYKDKLVARNLHELMRVNEAQEMLQVSKLSALASLHRKETRFGVFHRRVDYQETDDANFCGQVVLQKAKEEVKVTFSPLTYEIPEA
ncbi:MAG: FAD-dependent oxidoreductase [Chloroflexi bacterium]|nr:FAD-dependent oxidoreductase [Chloroflexota bacterium]